MSFTRKTLDVTAPNRAVGGLYRVTPEQVGGAMFGGVPLQNTEDAVVAAVRTSYRIADAQIERGMRIARELRGAATRAGAGEPRDMLQSAEDLIRRAMLLALEWVETLAAQPSSPLKRMLSAEYRLLGALIGLDPDAWKDVDKAIRTSGKRHDAEPAATDPAPNADGAQPPRPVIEFAGEARAIELSLWQLTREISSAEVKLKFTLAAAPSAPRASPRFTFGRAVAPATFEGSLYRRNDGPLVLELRLAADTPEGDWKAPVCDGKELVGVVHLRL